MPLMYAACISAIAIILFVKGTVQQKIVRAQSPDKQSQLQGCLIAGALAKNRHQNCFAQWQIVRAHLTGSQ